MKKLRNILYISPLAILLVGCASGNNTGIEYAPDMYYSKGYEPFSQGDSNTVNEYGSNSRRPVKGTIALGKEDYSYSLPNNGSGYDRSATEITMPSNLSDPNCEGIRLYEIYCAPCHGKVGKNDGKVFQKVTSLVPGAWSDGYENQYIKDLPVGQIYHTIMYGKNNMGSHASVLNPTQRWQVIAYVKQLSQGKAGCSNAMPSDNVSKKYKVEEHYQDTVIKPYVKIDIDATQKTEIAKSLAELSFETDSDIIATPSKYALDKLAIVLKDFDGFNIVINGHTDNSGDYIYNMILSKQRAEAVKNYLIEKGFSADRFITNGFGSRRPIQNNNTELGMAKNRRVEIEFAKLDN